MAPAPVPRPDLTQLKRQAKELLRAFDGGDAVAHQRVGMVLGGAEGPPRPRLKLADAQRVIARENGFGSWPRLKAFAQTGQGGPTPFQQAVLAVVNGDLEALASLLAAVPGLIRARADEPHRAQLLHYVAANGVDNALQRTPANAVAVGRLLIERGAEVDASCQTYGGGPNQTPMNLLVSSIHPFRAGVQSALVEALVDGGAAVDGPLGDSAPLRTALQFGYTGAALTLERRGARVEALDLAAGLGRVDRLAPLFDAAAGAGPAAPAAGEGWRPSPAGTPEEALHLASRNGQLQAVAYLLDRGVDPDALAAEGGSALHDAILSGQPRVAQLLLARGADPERRHGRWRATALGLAAYSGQLACVEALLAHGATADPGRGPGVGGRAGPPGGRPAPAGRRG